MAKKTQTPVLHPSKSALEWCEEQHKLGKELKFTWDGGGDSGWVEFYVDSNPATGPQADKLIDDVYELLDYGSWAGEFSASGEAIYDDEKKAFIGTDTYQEIETRPYKADVHFSVPKDIWFDDIVIRIEGRVEEGTEIVVSFNVKNGFLTPKHRKLEETIALEIGEQVEEFIQNIPEDDNYDNIWEELRITSNETKSKDEQNVNFVIETLNVGVAYTLEKEIYLELENK